MMTDITQRLYGVMGGVLLLRALDILGSLLADMLTPVGDLVELALGGVPSIIVGVFCLLMGVVYARGKCRNWTHWTMIVLSTLVSAVSAAMVVYFLTHDVTIRGHGMRSAMVAKHSVSLLFGVAIIVLASVLVRLNNHQKTNQTSQGAFANSRP